MGFSWVVPLLGFSVATQLHLITGSRRTLGSLGSQDLSLFMCPLPVASPCGLSSRVPRLLTWWLRALESTKGGSCQTFLRVRHRTGLVSLSWWPHYWLLWVTGQSRIRRRGPPKVWTLEARLTRGHQYNGLEQHLLGKDFHKRKIGNWENLPSPGNRWLCGYKAKIYGSFLGDILGLKALEVLQEHYPRTESTGSSSRALTDVFLFYFLIVLTQVLEQHTSCFD